MLNLAITFLVIALIAGVLGFGGIAGASVGFAIQNANGFIELFDGLKVSTYLDGVFVESVSAQNLLGTAEIVGGVTETSYQTRRYENFFSLDYTKELSEDFGLEASLGGTHRKIIGSSLAVSVTNLDIPNFYEISKKDQLRQSPYTLPLDG